MKNEFSKWIGQGYDDVDGADDNDDCDVYEDGTTLLQEINCTSLKSFSTLIAITQV